MQCAKADLVVIDNEQTSVYLACLMRPFRFRLVSVDLILRPPQAFKGRLLCLLKRALLTQVDKFILYFKNTAGYQRYYGISSTKIDYVAFKVNGVEESFFPSAQPEGDYVLCAGRTFRDVKTYGNSRMPGAAFAATRRSAAGSRPYSVHRKSAIKRAAHGRRWRRRGCIPEVYRGAKLVVIPKFKHDIAATGKAPI